MNLMFEIIGCLILSWIILALLYLVIWAINSQHEYGYELSVALFIMLIGIIATFLYFAVINEDTKVVSEQEYIQEVEE